MSDERGKLHKGHGSDPAAADDGDDFEAHKLHKGHGS